MERSELAKKVAESFVESLAAAGVERIYGVAADSLNGLTDSVRTRNGAEWVAPREASRIGWVKPCLKSRSVRTGIKTARGRRFGHDPLDAPWFQARRG